MYGWNGIIQGGGLVLMVVGMVVVFMALVLLMFMMKSLKRYQEFLHQRKLAKERAEQALQEVEVADTGDMPGVVAAAIALTILFEEEQVHDEESLVLTLNALPKPYSNWWQNRIDPVWPAKVTRGRSDTLRKQDPERGVRV